MRALSALRGTLLPVALHLHRAPRTDLLADALGALLSTPLADPFAQEVVVVPAKGVERWLGQRLSHRLGGRAGADDGVCAGVRFLRPASLVAMLLGREDDDPWSPERLAWPLLTTLDDSLGEPWAATLSAHLGHGRDDEAGAARRARRYSVALRLAHLFASYAVQRPALVTDWREGRDGDGAGGDLDPDLAWQPELWRRLLTRVDAEPPDVRHAATIARLRAGDVPDLPDRLSLFGHTRLPGSEVRLLAALGESREVHLYLPQPSPDLWDALGTLEPGVVAREDDPSATLVGHPLLASLGRESRELRRTLDTAGLATSDVVPADALPPPATLLGWLQHDLRADRVPGADERAARVVAPDDRTLQVHACHGPARQVDVLREVLVGLLQDDPTLEPRDILVMCPDIETYAPLVSAGFGLAGTTSGAGEAHPAHQLRVRLADRALTSTNPLLATAATLLELSGGRVRASDVLDLAATPACRRRFALTDDDLARVARWVAEAGVRWGLDASTREAFSMERFEHNTWRAGLDRILLGVAMSGDDHRHLGRGLPLDDVASSEIDLAGRLAELLDRLGGCLRGLEAATTVEQWMECLRVGVRELTDTGPDDAWQLPQLERELARAAAGADGRGERAGQVELRLPDVRALLESRLAGRPTRANFRTGTLTVCTMVPMRSVPHRVVCLVGLDDGVFPRSRAVDGDDVLARRPLTGERDPRGEDRQLLLDAVLAATEHLVVTYSGADEHSGATRPPAVPLGEVLDAADRTTSGPVRAHVLTRHPLQPHDARNLLAPGEEHDDGTGAPEDLPGPAQRPFSFDRSALRGARAAVAERRPVPPLISAPLPELEPRDLTLAELKAFLAHPVRAFLRTRLDVTTPFEPDALADAIPVSLDGLGQWQVGDHLLREVLAGADPVAVMTAEQLRGTLPPGRLGQQALTTVTQECQKLWSSTAALREGTRRSVDVDVDLGGGRRLTGTVAPVHGTRVVSLGYSRLKPRQRLETWVDLLAVSASDPDQSWTGHAVGRFRAGPQRALSGPLDERATTWLRDLVALRDLGLTRPLAMPVATAAAWAAAHHEEQTGHEVDPVAAARRAWVTDRCADHGIPGEDADAYHQRVWGARRPGRGAARRRPGRARLAGLGAAAHRRREGGTAVTPPPLAGLAPAPFDVADDLPTGTVLLEASAGTGKTWTIGALVTRYVAEGRARLEEMLVVTFGRAASQELRERVRAQLVEAERVLAAAAGDPAAALLLDAAADESALVAVLRGYDATTRAAAHRRVTEALADFDAATIATTHQFCALVLDSLGVAGDTDSRARLVEDLDDLVEETVDDLYLRAFAFDAEPPVFDHAEALAIARTAVGDPQARLEPADEDRTTRAGRRVGFARTVRAEVDRRKRRLGVLSYDDLLSQLADALADPGGRGLPPDAPAVVDRAGRRVPGHRPGAVAGPRPRLLRPRHDGADRRPQAGHLRLPRRRRRDLPPGRRQRRHPPHARGQPAHRRPAARRAAAAVGRRGAGRRPDRRARRRGPPPGAPPGRAPPRVPAAGARRAPRHLPPRPALDAHRGARCASTSPRTSPSTCAGCWPRGPTFEGRPLRPRDVAVIAHRHADLARAQEALAGQGVPAVIAGAGSVFATPAALEWLTLLEALEQPHRSPRVRAAALTCFFGRSAAELDAGGDDLTDEVAETLREWVELVTAPRHRGRARGGLARRAHRPAAGARSAASGASPTCATSARRCTRSRSRTTTAWCRCWPGCASRSRRAAPAAAPSAPAASTPTPPRCSWSPSTPARASSTPWSTCPPSPTATSATRCRPLFHDDAGVRCRNVGARRRGLGRPPAPLGRGGGGGVAAAALRRRHPRAVPGRLLVGADEERRRLAAAPAAVPRRRHPRGAAVAAGARGRRRRRRCSPPGATAAALQPEAGLRAEPGADPPHPPSPRLGRASFTRSVDTDWRRTSYSALTRVESRSRLPSPGVGRPTPPGRPGRSAASPRSSPRTTRRSGSRRRRWPPLRRCRVTWPRRWPTLPVGATFGSLVHAVLEHTDPEAPDLRAELAAPRRRAARLVAGRPRPRGAGRRPGRRPRHPARSADRHARWAGSRCATGCASWSSSCRWPAATWPRPAAAPRCASRDLAPLLERHLPDGDPVRCYADALAGPARRAELRGYLTGSVDVVLRLRDARRRAALRRRRLQDQLARARATGR